MLAKITLIFTVLAGAAQSAIATTLPFNKRYDEQLLIQATKLPMDQLLRHINDSTDIRLVSVRNDLDKELPRTSLETSPFVKSAEIPLPQVIKKVVGDTHGDAGIMIEHDNPDIKVTRNTIYVNEFADGYTIIHEYMHSLLNPSPDSLKPSSNLEIYRAINKAEFLYGKIFGNRVLLNSEHWRQDMIAALEEHCDIIIKSLAATTVEEVLIEKTLSKVILPSSPHYNRLRTKNGLVYAQDALTSIYGTFNNSVDRLVFLENELKSLESISEEDLQKDLARLEALKGKYSDFRIEVVKLQEFFKSE